MINKGDVRNHVFPYCKFCGECLGEKIEIKTFYCKNCLKQQEIEGYVLTGNEGNNKIEYHTCSICDNGLACLIENKKRVCPMITPFETETCQCDENKYYASVIKDEEDEG